MHSSVYKNMFSPQNVLKSRLVPH